MRNPLEIGYRYVIPSLKSHLVRLLNNEYGFDQVDISRMLKMSRSTVSRYISMKRGSTIDLTIFSDVNNMLKDLANKLIRGELDKYLLEFEFIRITMYILGNKYLCGFHAKLDLDVNPNTCMICPKIFGSLKINYSIGNI
ncbi:MAG: transcriptional regulator [Candidatus Methanomethylicia archaeon]